VTSSRGVLLFQQEILLPLPFGNDTWRKHASDRSLNHVPSAVGAGGRRPNKVSRLRFSGSKSAGARTRCLLTIRERGRSNRSVVSK
jgi:hypothetical protein